MLYLLGPVTIDTKTFGPEGFERTADGGLIAKPTMGGRQRKEMTGEGEDEIVITGRILPTRIGGLTELETLHEFRRQGTRFPLMRGDGFRYGWYAVKRIVERHADLTKTGVGFTLDYEITLEPADEQTGDGQAVISSILSLFGALGSL